MATADEQIRVSDQVKRLLDRHRREGESYNDVLERLLEERRESDFYDGFGVLSDEEADWIRDKREQATQKRKTAASAAGQGRMKGLDATFLIDYLSGDPDVEAYYRASGGEEEVWVMPAPAYAEAVVGAHTRVNGR